MWRKKINKIFEKGYKHLEKFQEIKTMFCRKELNKVHRSVTKKCNSICTNIPMRLRRMTVDVNGIIRAMTIDISTNIKSSSNEKPHLLDFRVVSILLVCLTKFLYSLIRRENSECMNFKSQINQMKISVLTWFLVYVYVLALFNIYLLTYGYW